MVRPGFRRNRRAPDASEAEHRPVEDPRNTMAAGRMRMRADVRLTSRMDELLSSWSFQEGCSRKMPRWTVRLRRLATDLGLRCFVSTTEAMTLWRHPLRHASSA